MTISKYQFWLIQGNTSVRFPVNPTEFNVDNKQQNTTVNIEGLGEATFISDKSLTSFSFDVELPFAYYDGCEYNNFPPAETLYNRLVSMSRNSCRLIVTGTGINMEVTIQNLSYVEKGGDVGSYIVTLTLKEYRSTSVVPVNYQIQAVTLNYSGLQVTGNTISTAPPAPPPNPWQPNARVINVSSWLWVRNSPNGATVGKMYNNERFMIIDTNSNPWYKIKYKDSAGNIQDGYSHSSYIRRD
jgi:hypothetical protein